MSPSWAMARKDLLRRVRAPLPVLLTLAFPLIFAALLALAFGRGGEVSLPRASMLIEDHDQTLISGLLISAFRSEPLVEYLEVESVDDGRAAMEAGEASALLVIPQGFADRWLRGEPLTLELVRNPAQGILPEIAEQIVEALRQALDSGSRLLREPLDRVQSMLTADGGPSAAEVSQLALVLHSELESVEALLLPPAIELVTVEPESTRVGAGGFRGNDSVFLLVLPGIAVWSLFLLGDLAMRDLLTEERQGTLRRQLLATRGVGTVVRGKLLYTGALAGCGLAVLVALGLLLLDRPVSLPAFVLVSCGLILAICGFSAAIYGLAPTERSGTTLAAVLTLVFAFLGGSFVPAGSMPAALQRVAPVSPFWWGADGFTRIVNGGARIGEVTLNAGVLAAFGAALLLLGSVALDRRLRRSLG